MGYDRPVVYLAGPIRGLSYEKSVDWRGYVSRALAPEILAFSPMRSKEHLAGIQKLMGTREDNPITSQKGIVARDADDVIVKCNLMFVNFLGATEVSIGTCVEYGMAYASGKRIVLVMEPEGNWHDHPFIRELTGYRVSTLEEGIASTKAFLLP